MASRKETLLVYGTGLWLWNSSCVSYFILLCQWASALFIKGHLRVKYIQPFSWWLKLPVSQQKYRMMSTVVALLECLWGTTIILWHVLQIWYNKYVNRAIKSNPAPPTHTLHDTMRNQPQKCSTCNVCIAARGTHMGLYSDTCSVKGSMKTSHKNIPSLMAQWKPDTIMWNIFCGSFPSCLTFWMYSRLHGGTLNLLIWYRNIPTPSCPPSRSLVLAMGKGELQVVESFRQTPWCWVPHLYFVLGSDEFYPRFPKLCFQPCTG